MLRSVTSDARGVVSVHDAILAAIPLLLALATLAGAVLSWSWATALAVGSVPASTTIGYALFYNPPAPVGEN